MATRAERAAERDAKRLAKTDGVDGAAAGSGGGDTPERTGDGVIDLATVGDGASGSGDNSGERKRRKYSPRRSAGAAAQAPVSVRDALSGLFLTAHAIIASLADNGALVIDQAQSEALGDAASKVARHYVSFDGVAGPAFDWINLGITAIGVYGPMINTVREQRAARVPPVVASPHAPLHTQSQPAKPNGAGNGMERVTIPGLGITVDRPEGTI